MAYQNASEITARHCESPATISDTVEHFFSRIHALNPQLNAYVQLFEEQALQRAHQLAQHADPTTLPLFGVPVSIKESFSYSGSKTTINFPPLKKNVSDDTSILATRLEEAGAIILGKTNVPMLLADCQTFGPIYPTANNPYDLMRTPGGSTGGGAAALAGGLSSIEIGSDIGGSIRNPASFCGVFGLKPTRNGHVQDGHIPPIPGRGNGFTALNSTGPLARSMEDLRKTYSVCYAPRPEYQHYLDVQTDTPTLNDLSGYKIGWFDEVAGLQCSAPVSQGLGRVLATLETQGAKTQKIKIDDQLSEKIYSSWLKIFGFVIGQDFPWIARQLTKLKFNHDLRNSRINSKGALSGGLSMNFKKYSEALAEQQECIAEFYRLFEGYDFILSPTSIGPAFEHNPKHRNIELLGQSYAYPDYCFLFVTLQNLTGFPVLTIPSGIDETCKLPIGISVIGRHHCEQQLMHFGELMEKQGFRFEAPNLDTVTR